MSEFHVKSFLQDLESGKIRATSPDSDGFWKVHSEVKEKILEIFRTSELAVMDGKYLDKSWLVPRVFSVEDGVRIPPTGSCVRAGVYIAKGVVIMPPSYINIGAYVDEETMIDSHVLVGSCAQLGKRIHVSAGVSIGGVLEPIEALPVIIEDEVFLGAGCTITSGIHIHKRAVLGSGLCLSRSVPIYDTVNQKIYYGHVPENAVVVPGTRSLACSSFENTNLALNCGVIIKYRDIKTDAHTALEQALR